VTSPTSRWTDLDRPPLSQRSLTAGLVRPDGLWREVRLVDETGSTNADVLAAARAGAAEGLVVVAELQTAGRGRLGRDWASPPRAGLTFSVLLRPPPAVPARRRSWLPLLVGLSLHRAVTRLGEVEAWLKWPNDLLLGPGRRKAAGLLLQADGGALVVGVGLNVTTREPELPGPAATSLALEGAACTDRDPLLRAALRQLANDYLTWCAVAGDPEPIRLRTDYLAVCDTIGRAVQATLPSGETLAGLAVGVDAAGALQVRTDEGERAVSAGDVVRVR
jgi:BirA family transcriptional regulator, biotin operon repressor / biotin---[acetyl-CoA-carboxylase] ligase